MKVEWITLHAVELTLAVVTRKLAVDPAIPLTNIVPGPSRGFNTSCT